MQIYLLQYKWHHEPTCWCHCTVYSITPPMSFITDPFLQRLTRPSSCTFIRRVCGYALSRRVSRLIWKRSRGECYFRSGWLYSLSALEVGRAVCCRSVHFAAGSSGVSGSNLWLTLLGSFHMQRSVSCFGDLVQRNSLSLMEIYIQHKTEMFWLCGTWLKWSNSPVGV